MILDSTLLLWDSFFKKDVNGELEEFIYILCNTETNEAKYEHGFALVSHDSNGINAYYYEIIRDSLNE